MIRTLSRSFSSSKGPTGIVMLNMGGPATVPEVGPFLQRLFSDGEIVQLGPLQNILGPYLAKRRTPRIEKQYAEIGGSPIRKWTEIQGAEMVKKLDVISPETAPHKFYVAFRYANPLSEEALLQMKEDGVKRAVAFSQYPQYSCTTIGSSLNHLWRECERLGLKSEFQWSVIDRWPTHPKLVDAFVKLIENSLQKISDPEKRERAVIMFSAHSLPMKVVNKGDQYPQEVGATTQAVMEKLRARGHKNGYILAWQSQVGPLPWLGPQTGEVIKGLGRQGHKDVVAVPIAFTSDHVETLYEMDIEYGHVAKESGINFIRCQALNDEPLLIEAQSQIVSEHLKKQEASSTQYKLNCPGCTNPSCRSILNPAFPYQK